MDWLTWLLSFIGVIGLIFLLFYALKKLNKRVGTSSGSRLRVLDRLNVGRDGMLLVVSVAGKLMLIGVTSQRMEKLCELEQSEEEYFSFFKENSSQDFKSTLYSVLLKKHTDMPKENGRFGAYDENEKNDTDSDGSDNGRDEIRH